MMENDKGFKSSGPVLLVIPLMALAGCLSATGFALYLHGEVDRFSYALLRLHRTGGLVLYLLVLAAVFVHVARFGGRIRAAVTVLIAISWAILQRYDVPFEFNLAGVSIAITAWAVYLVRVAGREKLRDGILGALALVALLVQLEAGSFLSGPFTSLRGVYAHSLHRYMAIPAIFFFAVHALLPPRRRVVLSLSFFAAGLAPLLAVLIFYPPEMGKRAEEAFVEISTTDENPPDLLDHLNTSSASCDGPSCHGGIFRQWASSTHRFAGENLFYLKVLEEYLSEKGEVREAIYCERCHNPLAVLSGAWQTGDVERIERYRPDGVGCFTCHVMHSAEADAYNGRFSILIRPELLGMERGSRRLDREAMARYIQHDSRDHFASYGAKEINGENLCSSCHRVVFPQQAPETRFTKKDVYVTWKESRAARAGLGCVDCHTQLNRYDRSYEGPMHARPDHRFTGLNYILPLITRGYDGPRPILEKLGEGGRGSEASSPGSGAIRHDREDIESTARFTVFWVRGGDLVPEYEKVYLRMIGSKKIAAWDEFLDRKDLLDMSIAWEEGRNGKARVRVSSTNTKMQHVFPGGLHLMITVGMKLEVTDSSGEVIYACNATEAGASEDCRKHRLGGEGYDAEGRPITKERFWMLASTRAARLILPDETVTDDFEFPVPPGSPPPYKVEASWILRRPARDFALWALGKETVPLVVACAESSKN